MFKSLTSFIFGTDTSETINQDQPGAEREEQQQKQPNPIEAVDAENLIEIVSCTPSVTGAGNRVNKNRRGKNKRNKRKTQQQNTSSILIPSDEREDEDLDEDDWFIVEKEDDDLPRSDSVEELSVAEVKQLPQPPQLAVVAAQLRRRQQHIGKHSLYSGPRPQQQRNSLQRARSGRQLTVSALGSPQSVTAAAAAADGDVKSVAVAAITSVNEGASTLKHVPSTANDGSGVTQSLYAALPKGNGNGNGGALNLMEESWFVTPPPCFTSIGPIHMETSPYENLLIEHPSMSVYFSIKSEQDVSESFVDVDIGLENTPKQEERKRKKTHDKEEEEEKENKKDAAADNKNALMPRRDSAARFDHYSVAQLKQRLDRNSAAQLKQRLDRYNAAQLKQQLLAHNNQKNCDVQERRQSGCRSALIRANKSRDFQSKAQPQRRADMQHYRLVSGANNNRKCCF